MSLRVEFARGGSQLLRAVVDASSVYLHVSHAAIRCTGCDTELGWRYVRFSVRSAIFPSLNAVAP